MARKGTPKRPQSFDATENRYRRLIEQVPELVAVHSRGRFRYVNRAGLRLLGAKRASDLVGKSVLKIVPRKNREIVRKRIRKIETRGGVTPPLQQEILRLDGEMIWVEASGVPVLYEGSPATQVVMRNITSQKQAEEKLRESEESYRRLVENSPEAICIHVAGVFAYVNSACMRLFGARRTDQIVGRPILDFVSPEYHAIVRERIRMVQMEGHQSPLIEMRFVRLDGQTVEAEVTGIPISYRGKNATQAVLLDVSGRKRLESIIRNIAIGVSSATGNAFFQTLVQHLTQTLGVEYALIGEVQAKDPTHAKTIAFARRGKLLKNFEYPLEGDACAQVIREKAVVCHASGMKTTFALPTLIRRLRIESYLGAPLLDSGGNVRGLLVLMHTKPLQEADLFRAMIQIFSVRTAAELERLRAEEALRESEARYRALLDEKLRSAEERYRVIAESAPVGIAIVDRKGRIEYANSTAARMAGISRHDLQTRTHDDPRWNLAAIDGRPLAPSENPVVRVMQSGNPVSNCEFAVDTPGNGRLILSLNATPLRNPQGEIEAVLAVASDITERTATEKALRESEERFRLTFDQAAIGIAHVSKIGRFLRVNRALCDILGYSRDELLELSFQSITHPDDLEGSTEKLRAMLAGELQKITAEKRYVRKDGASIWVRLTVALALTSAGEADYFISVIEDITDRKKAEKDLSLLASITSMSVDAISAGDERGAFTLWNQAAERIFGFTAEEVLGKHVRDVLVPPERMREVEELLKRNPEDPRAVVLRLRTERLHKSGRRVPVMVTSFPITDEKGEPTGRAGIHQDLTEIVEMEQRLLEQSRMAAVGTVAAGVAHEIRNPLFGISSIAQIVRRETTDNTELRELVDSMLAEIERLKKLLEDLLLFARPRRLEFTSVSPRQIWKELDELQQPLYAKKGLHVTATFDPPEGQIRIDVDQIRQVLLNLFLNAIQASEEGGALTVTSKAEQDRWTFQIMNQGELIGPGVRERVFEPFFSTKSEGTGLGLSICKKILEEHGGELRFQSTPGHGTTFTFVIPLNVA